MERASKSADAPRELASNALAALARFLLTARQRRETAFPGIPFGEPAWDMLLALYLADVEKRPFTISSLCSMAAVPTTTALRSLNSLVRSGHFVRTPDPANARRTYVHLAPSLMTAIEAYLRQLRPYAETIQPKEWVPNRLA